jgi:DNA-binding LacI/PurR family transcriptional regulator
MKQNRVTIRDVARQAGVSHQTVSRVINDSRRVAPETRARVEAAIAALDYRPNAIARSMAKGRSSILACVSPNLTDFTFASLIDGAEREARRHGYYLMSASAPDVATFAALVDELVTSRRTDGLMVINPFADERHRQLPPRFPTVFAGARPRAEAAYSVALDDYGVGQQATEHLLALGHRQIALVTGPMAEDCAQDRRAGYEAALAAASLPLDDSLIIEGDWQAPSGARAMAALLAKESLPTAVVAQNDQMALGLIHAATVNGLQVPRDLSVIGVDDIPLVSYFSPPLTTLRQEFAHIGCQAARLLIRAVKTPQAERQHLTLPAKLIVRGSTSPPGQLAARQPE